MEIATEDLMLADRVEVTWDGAKSSWLIRIVNGEEVIRRHCKLPRNSGEQALRTAVQKVVTDEGFEADPVNTKIQAQ
jgi:hypothetical protein